MYIWGYQFLAFETNYDVAEQIQNGFSFGTAVASWAILKVLQRPEKILDAANQQDYEPVLPTPMIGRSANI